MSYSHKMDFNRKAEAISGIQVLNNVAKAFGMFWWFFGALSIWATYYTLDEVLTHHFSEAAQVLLIVAFGISLIWEVFKYFSMEWVFADQVLSTKMTSIAVALVLVMGSMWFHVYGSELRNSNSATAKVQSEVDYQRTLAQQKLDLQNRLLNSNKGLEVVLNNGSARDDAGTVGTMNLNLKLIEKLQNEKAEGISSNELLAIYGKDMKIKADGVMYAQIIAEMFLLFSLLSKFIYKANRDEQLKDYNDAKQDLSELLYLAKTETTASFINAALDELNGYTMNTNRTGLSMIQEKIERARTELSPKKEIENQTPAENSYTSQDREPVRLGQGLKRDHKPQQREVVDECEEVEFETAEPVNVVEAENERVKALDLTMFEEDDKKLLKILFDNGDIHKGDFLIKREIAIIEAGEVGVARAATALTALYGNLLKSKMISRPSMAGRYKAEVSLKKEIWTDKE